MIIFKSIKIKIQNEVVFIPENSVLFLGNNVRVEIFENLDLISHIYSISATNEHIESIEIFKCLLETGLFLNEDKDNFLSPFLGMEADFVNYIYNKLVNLYHKNKLLYKVVANNCFEYLLLNCLYSIEGRQGEEDNHIEKLYYKKIINQFKDLVDKEYTSHKDVSYYAKKLFLSTKKLGEITKEYLGISPKRVIINKLIKESVNVIKNTDLPISTIAFNLGFSDEGNFSKFIKTYTGITPSNIRNAKV